MTQAPAADYTLKILEAMAESDRPMGISELSRETGVNKNAVSRVLNSLLQYGWICQDETKYQLTLKPFRLMSRALSRMDLYTVSQPVLRGLWEQTGDSCYLGILRDLSVLYIEHFDATHDIKINGRVGGMYPLHCSAPGKVLLAYSDPAFQDGYCKDHLVRHSEHTVTYPETMKAQLNEIRKNGFATDLEESGSGILCFAAPIFDCNGRTVGAAGVSTSTIYATPESLISGQGKLVLAAVGEISRRLGYKDNNTI